MTDAAARLLATGVGSGGLVALVLRPGAGAALVAEGGAVHAPAGSVGDTVTAVEDALRPRWVWWSNEVAAVLLDDGLRMARCWDLAAVHRLLVGGWRADPALIWAGLHDLDAATMPGMGQLDLLGGSGDEGGDPEDPVQPDGHLRAEWASGGWARTDARAARWGRLALEAAALQRARLAELRVGGDALATARSESAAELLSAELAHTGLPVDRARAEELIAGFVGPRPADEQEAAAIRRARDRVVLDLLPAAEATDLRNPAQVKALLRRAGIDVPDTRSWRLEGFRGAHPVVAALLRWRKDERISTTYGYGWLDERVSADGRLRGAWSGSDGAAGRMTAQAGLHNLPAELRPAVVAEAGHVFVRADLGQIEPRVLAVVSGDPALIAAAREDDLYAPVASRLRVERPIAKVAVLAAMYGQTSGTAGAALQGLESAYPVAMRYLHDARDAGRDGRPLRTYGGRLIRMPRLPLDIDEDGERSWLAGRGRFARNAVIQGAAAEFFKAWAVTVRTRSFASGARIVLCLHDELLVHVPTARADEVAALLDSCLLETAQRWSSGSGVRFVADVSIVSRWSDAKG